MKNNNFILEEIIDKNLVKASNSFSDLMLEKINKIIVEEKNNISENLNDTIDNFIDAATIGGYIAKPIGMAAGVAAYGSYKAVSGAYKLGKKGYKKGVESYRNNKEDEKLRKYIEKSAKSAQSGNKEKPKFKKSKYNRKTKVNIRPKTVKSSKYKPSYKLKSINKSKKTRVIKSIKSRSLAVRKNNNVYDINTRKQRKK